MVSVDTNIIIRFLTRDDAVQHKKSFEIFNNHEVFIPDTVILKTEWVLRYAYDFSAEAICDALLKLFGLTNVHLSNPAFIAQAIQWHRLGMDFSDALHLTQSQPFDKLYTFDKKFISKAKGLSKCSVERP
ncbi:MAG: type II toxin-antitoxin system VapC family toxin [gamma proteobacterium symbiont of Bathyaustriella thionipta]|nr:type II toxin-antitoxin system VapC family toxin [gamma proteobacterium symbiont of Bathyaustriella thionipta]